MRHRAPPPDLTSPTRVPPVAPTRPTRVPPVAPTLPLQAVHVGLDRFRRMHGKQLAALGWNRDSLFLGMRPEEEQHVADLHGMAVILAYGAELLHADHEHLVFAHRGERLGWFRGGYWLAGPALDERTKRTEA
ncbi:MAG: hypothetical protein H7834_10590 [Magnetococcus sp. YQC-9]